MATEVGDRVRTAAAQFDFVRTRMRDDFPHQLCGMALPTSFNGRLDMGDHANAASDHVISDRLHVGDFIFVALGVGVIAKLAHNVSGVSG